MTDIELIPTCLTCPAVLVEGSNWTPDRAASICNECLDEDDDEDEASYD